MTASASHHPFNDPFSANQRQIIVVKKLAQFGFTDAHDLWYRFICHDHRITNTRAPV